MQIQMDPHECIGSLPRPCAARRLREALSAVHALTGAVAQDLAQWRGKILGGARRGVANRAADQHAVAVGLRSGRTTCGLAVQRVVGRRHDPVTDQVAHLCTAKSLT
jgi:uncharacterized protein (DUF3084 family)